MEQIEDNRDEVVIVERPLTLEANGGKDDVMIVERPRTPEANGDPCPTLARPRHYRPTI